ncbi:class I SAM-dependent methyltransferase [Algoriphagus kandeliae]|uniref:Class I SAM-dependent methyltransferase n=1 Tax=Algoriphagus kandeliae TaxID=2562278 RepID=A0A4Y9QXP6_9BACT|nr:class I SAM-dependent methyltransferase [Algoriphagus kandeliae]TFV97231.1 class I SAM-dependent methyltransferase [Algoriphagus kandeliae]
MWKYFEYLKLGRRISRDFFFQDAQVKSSNELNKVGKRTDVINILLSLFKRETAYLEIGVRDPKSNFLKINSRRKFCVDPGFEMKVNEADFKFTSDEFFLKFRNGEFNNIPNKFDVIFIDGLHTAEQVNRDIINSLDFLAEDGFIVLHDCNPPTEWHSREKYSFKLSPAGDFWNGTTWKAFLKWRQKTEMFSCCVDIDWGVGVLSKRLNIGEANKNNNEFFEFENFNKNRSESLNLISLEKFEAILFNQPKFDVS